MKASILAELTIFRERNMKPNFSKLASENGIDRRTVKKYYENPNPVRKRREHHSYLEKHDPVIRDKVSIPGMTYAGIRGYLVHELGIQCTYQALTWYCRKKEYHLVGSVKGPHVRYETDPGHQVQVDWKEDLRLRCRNGNTICFNVYSATLGFSRKHIFIYSPTKTEQDFLRCTNEMLLRYGGATAEILTDNMSAIVSVSEQGKGEQRRKHQNIMQWESDSGIRIRLCKPRSPETKGKDESANRFVNRLLAYDGAIDSEDDIRKAITNIQNDANDKTNNEIGMSPEALFQLREKQALRPLPNMSLLASYIDGGMTQKVPNTLLVPFQKQQYSVPPDYLGKRVRILRNGNTIEIYYNKVRIACHTYVEEKRINYRKEDYIGGLSAAMGDAGTDLERIAEENLRRFEKR